MAKWYGLDPGVVDEWTNINFLDRQEFMFIQNEVDRREMDKARRK